MFKQILIAYDGSEAANKAFRTGLNLAVEYRAALWVLAVVRPPDFAADVDLTLSNVASWESREGKEQESVLHSVRQQHDRYLQQFMLLRERAMQTDVVPEFQIIVGHPAAEIVLQAEKRSADLIVVGHRGNGLFERWLLGSIAKAVIAHAKCTVLVAR